jgi:hypothetical protein
VIAIVVYVPFMLFNIVTITAIQGFLKRFGTVDRPIGIVRDWEMIVGSVSLCVVIVKSMFGRFDTPIISFHFVSFFKVVCEDLLSMKNCGFHY